MTLKEIITTDIKYLNFSARTHNALRRNGINTIRDLLEVSLNNFNNIKNVGIRTIDEINSKIEKFKFDESFVKYLANKINVNVNSDDFDSISELIINEVKNENIINDCTDKYLIRIKDTPISQITKELLCKKSIKNIGQLIMHNVESLLISDDIFAQNDNCISLISEVTNYLYSLNISDTPVKFSYPVLQKINFKTLEDVLNIGLTNYIIDVIENCLSALDDKNIQVLKYRFGINGDAKLTLEEIGAIYNVTRERIRQIEMKSMKKICEEMKNREYESELFFLSSEIFSVYGPIFHLEYVSKLKAYEELYLKLFHNTNLNFKIDFQNGLLTEANVDFQSLVYELYDEFYENNSSLIFPKDIVISCIEDKLQEYMNFDTEATLDNFNIILDKLLKLFIENYTIEASEGEYKILKTSKLSNKGKMSKHRRDEEIILMVKEYYPQGIHLPIDNDSELEKDLEPLIARLKEKICLRYLSDRIIKGNKNIVNIDRGIYIHIDHLNVNPDVLKYAIEDIREAFKLGIKQLKIAKIFQDKKELYEQNGIYNEYLLGSLIKIKKLEDIGIRQNDLYDKKDYNERLDHVEILESFMLKKEWVTRKEIEDEMEYTYGWKNFQVLVALSDSKNIIRNEMYYTHKNNLNIMDENTTKLINIIENKLEENSHLPLNILKKDYPTSWYNICNKNISTKCMSKLLEDFLPDRYSINNEIIFNLDNIYNKEDEKQNEAPFKYNFSIPVEEQIRNIDNMLNS